MNVTLWRERVDDVLDAFVVGVLFLMLWVHSSVQPDWAERVDEGRE